MRAYCYRITIAGELSETDREDLADFCIECDGTNTVLVGDLDQADVFGIFSASGHSAWNWPAWNARPSGWTKATARRSDVGGRYLQAHEVRRPQGDRLPSRRGKP